MPPVEVPVSTPVPLVPAASVVAVLASEKVVAVLLPILKPEGSEAVAELPIPSKFSVVGVTVLVTLTCPSADRENSMDAINVIAKTVDRNAVENKESLINGDILICKFI
jgi:tRNA G37 N-methylase Trm5